MNIDTQVLHQTATPLSPRYEPDYFHVTGEIKQYVPKKVSKLIVCESHDIENGKLYELEFDLYFKREYGKQGGTWLRKTQSSTIQSVQ